MLTVKKIHVPSWRSINLEITLILITTAVRVNMFPELYQKTKQTVSLYQGTFIDKCGLVLQTVDHHEERIRGLKSLKTG